MKPVEIIIKERAKALQQTLTGMLGDEGAQKLYSHAIIQALYRSSDRPPSYIPTRTFVVVAGSTPMTPTCAIC